MYFKFKKVGRLWNVRNRECYLRRQIVDRGREPSREIGRLIKWLNELIIPPSHLEQGKFIRIHFGPSGKLAGADIETCEYFTRHILEANLPAHIPRKKSSRGC